MTVSKSKHYVGEKDNILKLYALYNKLNNNKIRFCIQWLAMGILDGKLEYV